MSESETERVPASPAGYGPAQPVRLPALVVNVVALVAGFAAFVVFGAVNGLVRGPRAFDGLVVVSETATSIGVTVNAFVVGGAVLVALVVTIVLHEAVHGLVLGYFGYDVSYGAASHVGGFYAAAFGQYVSRAETVWVLVAPLIVLDVLGLGLLLAAPNALVALFAWMVLTLNTGGAAADLWSLAFVQKLPADVVFCDVDLRHSYWFESAD
ncbi:DUF3267 domain-containing protein [Halocalculus aciditolerans]|uniref:Zincin peptidase n=1 Tax=Halocalculus aciditolerans TaxID=1383812 RepID=A0A830F3M0_9EURY|nr:DUF3267 domain-containing protein [Halocalculus aciditolerans]GGL59905.1 hypothetical protein GCM10009039_17680 [Halocalculus aciditolerans]